MEYTKSALLALFRQKAETVISTLPARASRQANAASINQYIGQFGEEKIQEIKNLHIPNSEKLSKVLLISYVRDIVMLEYRNKVWPYEYMAFSRRIGEIWEPFCKLPFYYPSIDLTILEPSSYETVKQNMIASFVSALESSVEDATKREELKNQYTSVWKILDSGNIRLDLDLHFLQTGTHYNVDYKSGFGSNEKGNTNRLLQVGCIYHMSSRTHKNLIFVRQPEEDNNHYLQTLKNSPYWEVFCSDAAYEKIKEFTGCDLKAWMNENMNWEEDISQEFKNYLIQNNLIGYLAW